MPVPRLLLLRWPATQYPRFKKESDVRFVADGTQSPWKGDCCVGACNNHGDVIEVKDGKLWWQPGDSNVVPPCFKGKQDIAYMTVGGAADECDDGALSAQARRRRPTSPV